MEGKTMYLQTWFYKQNKIYSQNQLMFYNQLNSMGNNVNCCTTQQQGPIATRQILSYENLETSNQRIEDFFKKYPRIKDVYQRKSSYCPNIDRQMVTEINDMIVFGEIQTKKETSEVLVLYKEGYLYEGEIAHLARNGCGRLISADGDCYEGKWKANEPEGQGTYEAHQPKQKFTGIWSNGNLNGRGRACYDDGSVYEGQFYQNMRQGRGRVQYPDGSIYQGSFKANIIEGFGTLIGKNHKYEGSWHGGKMHGAGKSYWYNQDDQLIQTYQGQYLNGLKHGQGEYRWSNGRVFKGEWENGQIKRPSAPQKSHIK